MDTPFIPYGSKHPTTLKAIKQIEIYQKSNTGDLAIALAPVNFYKFNLNLKGEQKNKKQ